MLCFAWLLMQYVLHFFAALPGILSYILPGAGLKSIENSATIDEFSVDWLSNQSLYFLLCSSRIDSFVGTLSSCPFEKAE
jgi:hypothetical protein